MARHVGVGVVEQGADVSEMAFKSGSVGTSDGVNINYLDAGTGPVLLLLPGWSQTAAR